MSNYFEINRFKIFDQEYILYYRVPCEDERTIKLNFEDEYLFKKCSTNEIQPIKYKIFDYVISDNIFMVYIDVFTNELCFIDLEEFEYLAKKVLK